jgi:hypothetical protein
MKSIHYASDVFITGDEIADALVHFAEALARHEMSMAVDVPVQFTSGEVLPVSFLLGPASQLVAVPVPKGDREIIDTELVTWLKTQAASIGVSRARPVDNDGQSGLPSDYDL